MDLHLAVPSFSPRTLLRDIQHHLWAAATPPTHR
ncbi:hypothetical protein OROMI_008616 [Orobanche minor]